MLTSCAATRLSQTIRSSATADWPTNARRSWNTRLATVARRVASLSMSASIRFAMYWRDTSASASTGTMAAATNARNNVR